MGRGKGREKEGGIWEGGRVKMGRGKGKDGNGKGTEKEG